MNNYVTGAAIRRLREAKGITQAELAEQIGVTGQAVSKWETAKGLPDIALIESLAGALGVSVMELMNGAPVVNRNRAANMLRTKFYVCPVCGNVIHAAGEAAISCCGIALPALEAEDAEGEHGISVEKVEDEFYLTVDHAMSKEHYISFICVVSGDRIQLVKLYPEGSAGARVQWRGHSVAYIYCNRHGLFRMRMTRK